ncbi:glycosyltransferase [Phenylobacterium sp.]|uniref:glycosyltransferase n=1 Tax=Phenylobacterium sp. TaxID=1871053 RepID=UPI0025FCE045|nr:glycosyltransferase [Phenylobacterium sp.]
MLPPIAAPDRRGRPRVTVMIITYNHARYIAQAIESVLAQKTEFPFAIHVIDDCSTDGTSDIVRDYAARFPDVVKPFINKKNMGHKVAQHNFYRGMKTMDGDYIAILEGDDYWTSTERLQTHVAFLEANPDFVACANNTLKIYEDSDKEPELFLPPKPQSEHTIDDLISLSSFFHTSSITYRNVFRGRMPRFLRSSLSCDIFITIAHAQYGKIRFFPETWSAYRVHRAGLFSQMSQTKGWMWNIDSFRASKRWFAFRYFPQIAKTVFYYCDTLLKDGRPEDGLTPEKRRYYEQVRRRYRILDKAYRWTDLTLARWIPGWRPHSDGAELNLGCGERKTRNTIDVDIRRDVDADMVVDLERTPWPWPDNYAETVYFRHSLEHMGGDFKTFQRMMRELYRVCRPDARVVIIAKHPRSDRFANDPSCVRAINSQVLALFDARTPAGAGPEPLAARNKLDFEVVHREVTLDEPYRSQFTSGKLAQDEVNHLIRSNWNICSELHIELRARKPARGPAA